MTSGGSCDPPELFYVEAELRRAMTFMVFAIFASKR